MSDKTILEQWRSIAYDQQADRNKLQKFWATYFNIEKGIYEQLLVEPYTAVSGTVKELAEKYGLPNEIIDFIMTHHGAGMTKYFYITYKNAHPDEEVDKAPFTYPGPNPFTTEQAILMMADSVEAASRSLKDYTEESITELVNRVIDGIVADGFFLDCPITFHDISVAKRVIIERLKTNYHIRITYPELKTAAQKSAEQEAKKKKKK